MSVKSGFTYYRGSAKLREEEINIERDLEHSKSQNQAPKVIYSNLRSPIT